MEPVGQATQLSQANPHMSTRSVSTRTGRNQDSDSYFGKLLRTLLSTLSMGRPVMELPKLAENCLREATYRGVR